MCTPAPPWPPGREPPKLLTLVMPRCCGEAGGAARVLLGMKKRGFGAGYFNGFGGKVEASDASVRAAAARELLEEAGLFVDASDAAALRRRGTLVFHFDDQPRPWRVAVYEATAWRGEPTETDEMAPAWFPEAAIPYARMWADDVHWYPLFLSGTPFRGTFWFRETTTLVAHQLEAVGEEAVAADDAEA